MKKVMLFLFVAILATSCNAQNSETPKDKIVKSETSQDSNAKPKGSWKVNKEVDENGNIIRYDSIYSWSSSDNLKGMDNDSIFNEMQSMMRKRFSMFQSQNGNGFMKHDSIMKQFFSDDIFKEDFFSGGLNSNFPNMDDMMKRMEAMRQQFFNDNHRYIIPPEETEKKEKKTNTIEKKRV
ncbi:hypothetical protein [Winogradskyella ouciana]|uniref:Lipoprotein n=1 Tax=Winogradskyella ouciana TaxID=2608631 RepID=A0A7K1GC32_9FLAO|nr:hypothetical protein [Winogradskyella ouciana]MTE26681.1 hypothetical protein [Winogradskyella ouciana]